MYQPFELSRLIEGKEAFVTTADGTRLYTITAGQGDTTVLLAHGYNVNNIEWNIIVPQLTEGGYRIIVFDQRGHGQSSIGTEGISSASMASDYKTIIEHFGLNQCILVGHSMGGFLSIKTLLTYPELQHTAIKACVLMATFAGDVNKHNFQNRIQIPMIRLGITRWLIKNKILGTFFAKTLIGANPDPELIRALIDIFLKQDVKPLIPILKAFIDESYYDQLHKITIPCIVVVGDKDKVTPMFHSTDMARLLSNASLMTIPQKGHCLNAEAPESIVAAVIQLDLVGQV